MSKTLAMNNNNGVTKRRSVAFGKSNAANIPPSNKNARPTTPMMNVTGRKSHVHVKPVRQILKRP